MSGSEDLGSLPQLLADLDEERAIVVVKKALGAGESALAITRAAERGMRLVGQHYEDGTYFLSGLIMAGEEVRSVLIMLAHQAYAPLRGSGDGEGALSCPQRLLNNHDGALLIKVGK